MRHLIVSTLLLITTLLASTAHAEHYQTGKQIQMTNTVLCNKQSHVVEILTMQQNSFEAGRKVFVFYNNKMDELNEPTCAYIGGGMAVTVMLGQTVDVISGVIGRDGNTRDMYVWVVLYERVQGEWLQAYIMAGNPIGEHEQAL
jgi:hypothetical protein